MKIVLYTTFSYYLKGYLICRDETQSLTDHDIFYIKNTLLRIKIARQVHLNKAYYTCKNHVNMNA